MEEQHLYGFGPFRMDVNQKCLFRGDSPIALTPRAFDTLLVLVKNCGRIIQKDEFLKEVWDGTFVEEAVVAQNVWAIRRVLGPEYIETVPKRGYRFVAEVKEIQPENREVSPEQQTDSPIFIEERERPKDRFSHSLTRTALALAGRHYPVALVLLLSIAMVGVFLLWKAQRPRTAGSAQRIGSVAVLPFKSLGDGANDELLGVGVADAMIVRLSRLSELSVIPTSSIIKYAGHDSDAVKVGLELSVDAVLTGTIQRAGEVVRVSVQMITTRDGKTLWSDRFEQPFTDVFALQDSISQKMAQALRFEAGDVRGDHATRHPANVEAYQSYLMGVYFCNLRTKENLRKAIDYLEQAVKTDPEFALAHAALADSYYLCVTNNWALVPLGEAYARADDHAAQALNLDDKIAQAHTVRASLRLLYRDYGEAERELRRALELDPSYAGAHLRYGYLLFGSLKLNEALEQMKRARELDPVSPSANIALGYMLYMSRDYDGAIGYFKRALEIQPELVAAHIELGEAYSQKEMFDEARSEFEKIKNSAPLVFSAEMICLDGASGYRKRALQMLSQVEGSGDRDTLGPFQYAAMYGSVNDKDAAFKWLEKVDANRINLAQLRFDPQFDTLRKDPRFEDWLKRHQA